MTEQDSRWEWIDVSTFGGRPEWIQGRCRHLDVVAVESSGATVAHLCLTCDAQLPEVWRP